MNNLVFSVTLLWAILQNILLWAHPMLYSFTTSLQFSNISKRSTQFALSYKMADSPEYCRWHCLMVLSGVPGLKCSVERGAPAVRGGLSAATSSSSWRAALPSARLRHGGPNEVGPSAGRPGPPRTEGGGLLQRRDDHGRQRAQSAISSRPAAPASDQSATCHYSQFWVRRQWMGHRSVQYSPSIVLMIIWPASN